MDSYVKTITLDVNADQNYTIVKAKQGDKINRKIAITLKKDGTNFTPTGVSEIWFRVEKPDKNIAIVKSTDSGNPISVSGNVYTVSLSEQCLTASGKAWCDLAFLDSSGNILSSCAFIMNIIPMPNGNTAESISEWTDLQKAIDDAERFADIVAFRTSGNYIQYTVDGQTWTNLVNVGAIGGDLQTQIDAVKDSVAQTYNTDTTYNVGDYAYRPSDRKLYRCIQNTSGAWNYAAWTEVSVSDELENVKGSLNVTQDIIATRISTLVAPRVLNVGDYVIYNDTLYRVTAQIANGAAITPNTNVVATTVKKIKAYNGTGTDANGSTAWLQIIVYDDTLAMITGGATAGADIPVGGDIFNGAINFTENVTVSQCVLCGYSAERPIMAVLMPNNNLTVRNTIRAFPTGGALALTGTSSFVK